MNDDWNNEKWQSWYRLTPQERMDWADKVWEFYLDAGGSLDPEPDSQSPFDSLYPRRAAPADGGTGLRVLRGGGVHS